MTVTISLDDKVALVTGAHGGVGSAVCAVLAEAGAAVALSDLDQGRLEAVRAGLPGAERHVALAADIGTVAGCRDLVGRTLGRFGRLDILVNVAAVLRRVPLAEVTPELFAETIDVNLRATLLLCQHAIPVMEGQGGGVIVNFTSPSAFTGGQVNATHYAASKAGVIALTRGLARLHGPAGIRSNVVCPGTTDTPMIRDTLGEAEIAPIRAAIPLGRLATPREIANGVLMLCSDLAGFINGTVLTIDGGASLRP